MTLIDPLNDVKNLLLAAVSYGTNFIFGIEFNTWITIASAIVLPCVFFGIGKTADILLQLHLAKRKTRQKANSAT